MVKDPWDKREELENTACSEPCEVASRGRGRTTKREKEVTVNCIGQSHGDIDCYGISWTTLILS